MKIIKAGNIVCECENDELVFVRALPPLDEYFVILCRKCMRRGSLEIVMPLNLRDLPKKIGGEPE